MTIKKYILSIDQSTSGTKAVIFNNKAEFVARASKEHKQYYPKPGWVEHDPEEIFLNTIQVICDVLSQNEIYQDEISHISITNQRETIVVWDRESGKPVYNAVVWQCMRGEVQCEQLRESGHESFIKQQTGLIIDPYFSASGLSWIIHSNEKLLQNARKGKLAAGTMDTWLIWKLTGGKYHLTDYSNASRTMLFNIHNLKWDEEICRLFDIPVQILPHVKTADGYFGETNVDGLLYNNIPIYGVLGDSHAALFGQRCFTPGLCKVTYGTGSSVMMHIGDCVTEAPKGLVTSIGFCLKDTLSYVFEGNIHSTGATIKWLVDMLELFHDPSSAENIATSVESSNGVFFVPAFSGLGAPYWNNQVRASISGISGGTTKAHITRAALESIAYQVKDLLDLMAEKAGIKLREIRVDGGPTKNNFLMQFQADLLNTPIAVSNIEEASALGAALAGGLGSGVWKSMDEIEALYSVKEKKIPGISDIERNMLYKEWQKAVNQLLK